jgi:cytochrome c biogenesis protein ResB
VAQAALTRRRYHINIEGGEDDQPVGIYAERGRWAQVGTLLSHAAALLLLLTILARPALSWREAGIELFPGQAHTVGHGRALTVTTGPLTLLHHSDGQLRHLEVPLVVSLPHQPAVSQTVSINHPLSVQRLSFHLQGFGSAAELTTTEGVFRVALDQGQAEEISLPAAGIILRLGHLPSHGAPSEPEEARRLYVEALNNDGSLIGSGAVADGQEIEIQGETITLHRTHYTLWQISQDHTTAPAVILTILLAAGSMASLWVPHSRLWLRLEEQTGQMVGTGDVGDLNSLVAEIVRASRPQGASSG